MTLKQIMLGKKVEQRKSALEELAKREANFKKRSEELAAAIEEAESDEEISTVEGEVTALEAEKVEHEEKKKKLEDELVELEGELEQLNSKAPAGSKGGKRSMPKNQEEREAISYYVRSKGQVRDGFTSVEGGALIPEEILSPVKVPEDVVDLSKYVRVVPVKSASGKYPVIKKSGGKMVTVAELEANPKLANPTITEVSFDVETYRGYIPVSQEVIDDADYDVAGMIAEDIQDQDLNTKNAVISAILKTAPAKPVTGLDGLITLFNKDFKQVYNVKAYVSASLYNELDLLKDKNGRYLLQDDITVMSGKRIKGKEIIVLDDEMIGTLEGDLVGFIGDAKEFAALFNRKQTSVKWVDNNIYGQLLASFVRFGAKAVDEDAGYYVTYTAEVPGP